jgi:glyoxylase-like metal-dependent hydrolase (beta-lactamase superfamily II)
MRRAALLGLLVACGALSMALQAFQEPQGLSPAALEATKLEKVRDNLYIITGSSPTNRDAFSGGNTAVFITNSGVVLVDTKLHGWGQVILDKVKTVTAKPVTMIINTHTHGDHTGSNDAFGTTVDIVAHANTKANMAQMEAFKRENVKFLPKHTFNDRMKIGSGPSEIDLYWFGRGHTNGDTWVVFPALGVMHTGDMFAWKDAPTLDAANGASGLQYAATIHKALATVRNVDTLIVGHSPVRTVDELREYEDFMNDFVDAVKDAKADGKSVDEAAASINLNSKYQGYDNQRYKAAIQVIYNELK